MPPEGYDPPPQAFSGPRSTNWAKVAFERRTVCTDSWSVVYIPNSLVRQCRQWRTIYSKIGVLRRTQTSDHNIRLVVHPQSHQLVLDFVAVHWRTLIHWWPNQLQHIRCQRQNILMELERVELSTIQCHCIMIPFHHNPVIGYLSLINRESWRARRDLNPQPPG